jgi:hypothetical protein
MMRTAFSIYNLGLDKPLSHFRAQEIQRHHHDDDRQQRRAGFVVLKGVDLLGKIVTDTAATHKTDDGGDSHVDIPVVNDV